MKTTNIVLTGLAAVALSGCVVLDTAPPEAVGPGPFLTGNFNNSAAAPAPAPAAVLDLRSQLAGQSFVSPDDPSAVFTFRADGFLVLTGPDGTQFGGGRWNVQDRQLCFEQFGGGFECGSASVRGSTLTTTVFSGVSQTVTLFQL